MQLPKFENIAKMVYTTSILLGEITMQKYLIIIICSFLCSACTAIQPLLPTQEHTDVYIEAGHVGPNATNHGSPGINGVTEKDWNKEIADAATQTLRNNGYKVLNAGSRYNKRVDAKVAVFIHADGVNNRPCVTSAAVGYPVNTENVEFAKKWKTFYNSNISDTKFRADNHTVNLSKYYNFYYLRGGIEMVIEIADITCPEQFSIINPKLDLIGKKLGEFIHEELSNQ